MVNDVFSRLLFTVTSLNKLRDAGDLGLPGKSTRIPANPRQEA